jgi:hypothetical protein
MLRFIKIRYPESGAMSAAEGSGFSDAGFYFAFFA